ncbi:hypothetical protein BG004_006261 [Podila humilis]|nr:hypothetical protein BG004_006261 [Podila humilis]
MDIDAYPVQTNHRQPHSAHPWFEQEYHPRPSFVDSTPPPPLSPGNRRANSHAYLPGPRDEYYSGSFGPRPRPHPNPASGPRDFSYRSTHPEQFMPSSFNSRPYARTLHDRHEDYSSDSPYNDQRRASFEHERTGPHSSMSHHRFSLDAAAHHEAQRRRAYLDNMYRVGADYHDYPQHPRGPPTSRPLTARLSAHSPSHELKTPGTFSSSGRSSDDNRDDRMQHEASVHRPSSLANAVTPDSKQHQLDPPFNSSRRSTETSNMDTTPEIPKPKGDQQSARTAANESSTFRFGTTMPTTIDLQSAIESCDALCKFALHYSSQTPPVGVQRLGSRSALDPDERANLHMIRSMNTTMLIGLQNLTRPNRSATEQEHGDASDPQTSDEQQTQTIPAQHQQHLRPNHEPGIHESPIQFGPSLPSNEMLAIRIKAWVGMTPAERELDEDINTIRGKRCLLMDKSLAVPSVDQHGNLQRDWAVVPGNSSNSKSFYERQRDMEQQRKLVQHPRAPVTIPPKTHPDHPFHTSHEPHAHPHPYQPSATSHGNVETSDPSESEHDYTHERGVQYDSGFASSSSTTMSKRLSPKDCSRAGVRGGSYALSESHLTKSKTTSGTNHQKGLNAASIGSNNDSRNGSISTDNNDQSNSSTGRRGSDNGNSTTSNQGIEVPHQKYRKRAKRTQPPGRCLSCDSSDTPEWRRGPDGARTLCNACGLHYAKLLKRQNEQKLQQTPKLTPAADVMKTVTMYDGPSSGRYHDDHLQIISFPLRRQPRGRSSELLRVESRPSQTLMHAQTFSQDRQGLGSDMERTSTQPSVSLSMSSTSSSRASS